MSLGSDVPSGQRRGRWSGVPLQDRQVLRRDELIAAGVELLGSEDGPALTVRAVCRAAGLTERYFYESFADRDEFVRGVYDDVCARAMSTLMTAKTPRDAVERFVALMVDDPVARPGAAAGAGANPCSPARVPNGCPFIDLFSAS